jgi:SAM-dependent methyltransferase
LTDAVFGPDYAAAYDTLYEDKDYAAECDALQSVFARYAAAPVRRVLDLGCGTGSHSVVLAERGYEVVGVDRSPDMLQRARGRDSSARFQLGDIASLALGEAFDAVLMMFAVLGYHVANADVQAALRSARRHLRPGGLFICDVWYGPAVLHEGPSERIKVMGATDRQLIRVASGTLDSRHHVCTVGYHLWRLEQGRVAAEVREQHCMRYFFPLELELFLSDAGFELVRLGAFPDLDTDATEATWNVAVVARAV